MWHCLCCGVRGACVICAERVWQARSQDLARRNFGCHVVATAASLRDSSFNGDFTCVCGSVVAWYAALYAYSGYYGAPPPFEPAMDVTVRVSTMTRPCSSHTRAEIWLFILFW